MYEADLDVSVVSVTSS